MASFVTQAATFQAQDTRRKVGHPLWIVSGDDDRDADLMKGFKYFQDVGC